MERKPSRPRRAVTRPFTISLKEGQLYNNRYEILRTAAFGGMSRIYEAIDTESGEKVALKVLSLSKIDDLLIRRFEREVQILQSLRHPNLVRAIDHGSTINGDLYLVLEWLKGLDLGDVMEEKVMGIREALEIGRGVLRGLEVVHQAGIVHRDLKPANVFVLENAQPPSGIKLLDFGVAKLVDEQMLSSVNRPLTSAGMVVGTPYYMSPEQAQGSSDIDHRADLFAIGAALYEMISGVRCYSASSALALLVKIATEEPEPIRSVMPNINDDVNDFLTKALKKKLDERFQSAREMEEAVAKVISTIEQDSPSTNRHVPSFEDGTERMDAVMLSDALNANMVEVEDLEVATSSEHKDKSSDANEITLPENRASDLEEAHPTMVIAQLTGFTQEPSSVMIHFQNAVESLGGTFKLIRRSLALGEFTNGLGMVGRALAASRETIQSVEQLRTDASIKGSIRISLTTALKASGPVDQLIDLACAQIEYAEPGEIIIDNNVREFGGEDLKSKTLRPGKHVVLSYQGIALAHSKDAKAGHLRNLPYSGRNEQLEVLFERSQTFIQQKTPKALLISGGLGMGKSRFIWDLKEKIDQLLPKSTVLITQCSRESRALPVQAITDALRRSCVIRIGENEETRFEKLLEVVPQNLTKPKRIQTQETLAQLLEDADPSIETYPPTIPATESTSSQRKNILQLHSDLSDFLLSCATNPALIFMVDDAHWCDRSSMNILEHLLNTKNIPFVLFLMVSPNQMSGSAIELLENVSKIENHELVALDVSATKTFAQAALQTPVSQEFAAKLTERTGGNPYYLEELLHSFIDAEDKSDKALREKLNAVPSNLYALINSRIQKLAEAETIFLSRAAVFGTHFWVQGLCALGIDNPQECIETLESADFIFPLETSRFSGSREYAFRNTLIRDVAYQAIRGANYRTLHRQAAEWLIEIGENDPVVLARHYGKADAINEACEALCIAANAALHSGDPAAALAFIEEGVTNSLSEVKEAAKFELLNLKRRALELLGKYDSALNAIDELIALENSHSQRSRSEFDRSRLMIARGNSADALRNSREALESIGDDGTEDESYGWLELALGDSLQARGDTINACTNYQNSYARAKKSENRTLSTAAVLRLARVAYSTSDLNQAIKLYEKAKGRYAQELENPRGEGMASLGLGTTHTMIGDFESAARCLNQAHHIFSALPDGANRLLTEVCQLWLNNEQSPSTLDFDKLVQLEHDTNEMDFRKPTLLCGILLLRKHIDRENYDEATTLGRRLFDNAIRSLPRYVIAIESTLGLSMAYSGDIDGGLKHAEAAVARLESQKAIEDDDPHRIYEYYGEILALAGQHDMARRVQEQALRTMTDVESRLTPQQQILFKGRTLNKKIYEQAKT